MQTLFQIDVGEVKPEKALDQMFGEGEHSAASQEFARSLVMGTIYHMGAIDRLIAKQTPEWNLNRIANVDRSILRMAVYEMLYEPEIPVNVSINEAIELAKIFGSDDSAAFVNGVLDQVRRSLDNGKPDHWGGQE